jgi:uncharacterized small protein (DUF1192 family)
MAQMEDDRQRRRPVHEIGQDLSLLSVEELDARIALLREEITRLEAERARKDRTRTAAESLFRRS